MILPANFANQVREGEEINFCPYCSRILYYEEVSEDQQEDWNNLVIAGSLGDLDDDEASELGEDEDRELNEYDEDENDFDEENEDENENESSEDEDSDEESEDDEDEE